MFSKALDRVALGASAVALSFGMAANAQALEIGCTPVAKLPEFRTQMAKEGQIPVIQFYSHKSTSTPQDPKLSEVIITMNPATKEGHRMSRADDGGMCVITNMKEMQLFDNSRDKPDTSAYLSIPGANAQDGINRVLFAQATVKKELPMLRAQESLPKTGYVYTFILANKNTGEGGIAVASLQGKAIDEFTKSIPDTRTAGVKHGAKFTSSGEILLGQSLASAGQIALANQPTLK